MKAAGPNFVAGCDTRWPPGSLYAGLGQFYVELARGTNELNEFEGIGIVSARPEQLAQAFPELEAEFLKAAEKIGVKAWGKIKKILPGLIEDNLHLHVAQRFLDYATTKFNNLKQYATEEENANLCYIFIGDNGQGDLIGGIQMLEKLPSVAAVFIHNVTASPTLPPPEKLIDDVHIFNTYPEAALIAHEYGLISKKAVGRVLQAAVESVQFDQCAKCAQKAECGLLETEPAYNHDDGACSVLFRGIRETSAKSGVEVKVPELPKYIVAKEIIEGEGSSQETHTKKCGPGFLTRWFLQFLIVAALVKFADLKMKPKSD